MESVKAFVGAHWKKLIPVVALIFGTFAGMKFNVKEGPPGSVPEITIILPGDESDSTPPKAMALPPGVEAKKGFHPFFLQTARVFAARELAKEKKTSFLDAWSKVRKVSDSDITAAATQAEIPAAQVGDGTIIKNIVNWFSDPANQAKLEAMIKFIMSMVSMFASADSSTLWSVSLLAWNC